MYRIADLEIELSTATVRRDAEILAVTDRSFELLRVLIGGAPEVVAHRDLLDAIWPGQVVSPETLKQRVRLLRQALGQAPGLSEYIVSVHGRGYRLGYPVEADSAAAASGGSAWHWALVLAALGALTAWVLGGQHENTVAPPPAASETTEAEATEAPPVPQPGD